MPPRRRSTRTSLPTPASSTKAESIASTPGTAMSDKKGGPNGGLITPTSLSDEGMEVDEMHEEIKVEQDLRKEEPESVTAPRGTKRKSEASDPSTPFSLSPTPSATSSPASTSSKTQKYTLESVSIPVRRSKLGTEKTTSADNLTLGSPASKRLVGGAASSSGLGKSDPLVDGNAKDEIDSLDDFIEGKRENEDFVPGKAKGKGAAKRPQGQPFNVGKYSNVKKQSAADLKLSAKERRQMKVGAEEEEEEQEEIELTDEEEKIERGDEDFAMDSDQEARQVKAAIKASKKGAAGRSARTSRASTSTAASSPAKGKGKAKMKNEAALRSAVAKAAQKRLGTSRGDETPSSSYTDSLQPPTRDLTPTSASESEFGLSDEEDDAASSALSALSDAEEFVAPKKTRATRARATRASKATGKGKGKGKGKAKGRGKGQRLDGEPTDGDSDWDEDGDEEDEDDVAWDRTTTKGEDENSKERKKRQNRLRSQLGRKLTNGEKNLIALEMFHPELENVWGDLAENIVPVKPTPMEAHPSLKLTLLPFQKESLFWMKKQEEGVWKGGMLADEMGMGKTIQTIALLLSEPRRKPSLVVAPVVALMQWKHEIENNAEGFTVCLWHGQGRMKAAELKKFDVVMVSYGTLEASFRRQQRGFKRGDLMIKEKSPMHEFEWYRVILDEAHNIKERSTNAAKAAFALKAKYKWCLSGTPLQNRVGELYSLVRFLGADPFSHYFCKKCDCKSLHWQFSNRRTCDQCHHKPMDHVCFWNTEILTPIARYGIEKDGPGHTAFKKLKILLDRMMLRRTKLERADDLGLPPRTIVVRRDFFSPAEKELYMSLFTNAKRTFATYVGQGTVLNNYSNIFSLITRMRQMACHPDLVLRSKTSSLAQQAALVLDSETTVCRLCNDAAEDAIVSQCKHVFDRECIRQYLEVQQQRGHRPECPVCHIEISIDLEGEALDLSGEGDTRKKARQGILSRLDLDNWRSSSKLEALVEELEKLRNKDCTIKSLVFSQFVSFLDLIAFRLQRAGFNICRLEGGMTPQQRDATIQHFMNNKTVTVFLISLKAGGVALNLTEASMVFMMDSWWNPSVEYQAMDRIHRLGQKRPVKVVKLVVEDSIEDQIVQLQHKKLAMTEAALNKDPDAALGKLTVEDLGFLFKM